MTKDERKAAKKVMKTKKKGNNWTAYYDEDNGRYFAEIMLDLCQYFRHKKLNISLSA